MKNKNNCPVLWRTGQSAQNDEKTGQLLLTRLFVYILFYLFCYFLRMLFRCYFDIWKDRFQIIHFVGFSLNDIDLAAHNIDFKDHVIDRIFLICFEMCHNDLSLTAFNRRAYSYHRHIAVFNSFFDYFDIFGVSDALPPFLSWIGLSDRQCSIRIFYMEFISVKAILLFWSRRSLSGCGGTALGLGSCLSWFFLFFLMHSFPLLFLFPQFTFPSLFRFAITFLFL